MAEIICNIIATLTIASSAKFKLTIALRFAAFIGACGILCILGPIVFALASVGLCAAAVRVGRTVRRSARIGWVGMRPARDGFIVGFGHGGDDIADDLSHAEV